MSNIKISELDSVETLTTDALVTVVQDDGTGTLKTFKGTVSDLLALVPAPSTGSVVKPPQYGEPGCSGLFAYSENAADVQVLPNTIVPGNELKAAGIRSDGPSAYSTSMLGSWVSVGYIPTDSVQSWRATVFNRIDFPPVSEAEKDKLSDTTYVRNPVEIDANKINCLLMINGEWCDFTASSTDTTWWGKLIHQNAVDGLYGTVG